MLLEVVTIAALCCFWNIFWQFWRRKYGIETRGLSIFISGCDSGIGHRLAIELTDIGCEVFAGCLNPEAAKSSLPDSVRVLPLDVTSEDSVRTAAQLVGNAMEKSGKDLWALINNAGVCVYGQFEWQTWPQCEKQIQVNLLGTIRVTKAFIPLLRKAKGRIITISSINGSIAYPGLSIYSASKFALEGFNNAIRLELNPQHGIRVITIQPGDYAKLTSIMSQHQQNSQEMWEAMSQEDRDRYGDFFHKYHEQTLKNYGLSSPNTFEGCPLLSDIKEAVFSNDPEDRYLSAPLVHRFIYSILVLSPMKITDFILKKLMEMIYNS